ncbi:hypothetical protein IKQ26_08000 [bacterium]|nr:hypothetical protein [bacterium]
MKKILCYGDSNTFGYNPVDSSRFDKNTRWTALLKKLLGSGFEVIEEGMCDRTGFKDNPKGALFSAQKHFPSIISKAKDIDVLILSIGTNDLQFQYGISFDFIEEGLDKLIKTALEKVKRVILIPPVILDEKVLEGFFSFQFNKNSVAKSKEVGAIYRKFAEKYNCGYFDINEFVRPSDFDGLHYDENGHKIIAEKLADYILNNLSL